MRVKLTLHGVPFGKVMDRETAMFYLKKTQFTLTGMGFMQVKNADA